MDVFRTEMDLNYFGLLHVIQSFLPLLKTWSDAGQKSRFIAVTSTIAIMPSFPGLSGYAASKAAADTLINTLRIEVSPFDVDVLTICPGVTKTPFLAKGAEQMRKAWSTAPSEIKRDYGEQYAEWWVNTVQFGIDWIAHDQQDSVDCLIDASTAAWPKTRYFSGLDARLLARPTVHVPDFVWDRAVQLGFHLLGQPPVNRRSKLLYSFI